LPVAGVPFVEHQLARLRSAGIDHVVLATSYRPEVFAAYAGTGSLPGLDIECVSESEPLGTGGGIRNVVGHLRAGPDDPVVVLNGDVLSDHDVGKQLAEHERVGAAVTLHLTMVDDARRYGCVPTSPDGQVTAFVEKSPDPSTDQVNAGCYVFRRSVIDGIPAGRPVSVERETFPALLAAGRRLQGYVERAYWLDIGTPESYIRANCDLALRTGPALVSAEADVAADAMVGGGSVVGSGVVVGSGAVIDGSVLLDGAHIGPGVRVIASAVGSAAVIGDGTVLEDAVVGDVARIGARNELRHGARVWPGVVLGDVAVRFSTDA
jgi:mannose-1-phosphate guanylyltransferase